MTESKPNELASLDGAFVVLGITGGIAAYKAAEICRRLVDAGAHVAPVLTKAATRFIGTATLSAIGSERAQTELFDADDPIPHTRLGQRADLVLVAPATATFLGEYANGIGHDLLGAVLLATEAPVVVAPAMHKEMWHHDAVQENLATLARRKVTIVGPASGRLAGGDVGEGRLEEPELIVARCALVLGGARDLAGLKVLVSAGGTREPIDPVRYVGNRSSGKQGHALAAAALRRGAAVTLVTTSSIDPPRGAQVVSVETAAEMRVALLEHLAESDVVVMAAAVADFRPTNTAAEKLKKSAGPPEIAFEPTADILAELTGGRRAGQVIVGFAAETDNVAENATKKLEEKGVDLLVVNDVSAPGVGFGHDTNAVTILDQSGNKREVGLGQKSTIADAILDEVTRKLGRSSTLRG